MDTAPDSETTSAEPGLRIEPPATELRPPFRGVARFVLRVLVFLALIGTLVALLLEPMKAAFLANPGLNGIILGVLAVGILLGLAVFRSLGKAVRAGNGAATEGDGRGLVSQPILSPLAAPLAASRLAGVAGGQAASALESVAVRLDDGRETLRYLAGLLVFLGLLGTFWGLLETVSSVGGVIKSLRTGTEAGAMFDELKAGLSAPLSGMGLSFSSSLFGIAGSLVMGFIDLQVGLAQRQIRHDAEGWLARLPQASAFLSSGPAAAGLPPELLTRLEQLAATPQVHAAGEASSKAATQAMANLADGIQGLVQHMRTEQQMIRDWVEAQASRERELKRLLERLTERGQGS